MNSKVMLSSVAVVVAALAAAASGVARADEADGSQYALQFTSTRTRAEVQAEAANIPATRSLEPAGSRVIQAPRSTLDPKELRAEAIQAARAGKLPAGELAF